MDHGIHPANSPEQSWQAISFDGERMFAGASDAESLNFTDRKSVSFPFKTTQSRW